MSFRRELIRNRACEAHGEKNRSDDDMETVKAGRHEEGGTIDRLKIADASREQFMGCILERKQREMVEAEGEGGVTVFVRLDAGERHGEQDRRDQSLYPS